MMAWHLGNPVGRRWWEYVKSHHWYGEEVAASVDAIVNSSSASLNRELLSALRSNAPRRSSNEPLAPNTSLQATPEKGAPELQR
jgi:hypothetical protein